MFATGAEAHRDSPRSRSAAADPVVLKPTDDLAASAWQCCHLVPTEPDFGGIAGYDGGGWVARGKAEAWPRFADHRVDGMLGGLSVGLDFLCMRVPDEA